MKTELIQRLPGLLETLGLDEEPMGMYFTDEQPAEGYTPSPLDLPTREKEAARKIDWPTVFGGFSCVIGNIWRARRKKTVAWFSAERFGCPGGAFWMGFMKPQTETVIHFVSSGMPPHMEGELYCESPDTLRRVFGEIDPPTAPKPFCVFKPLSLFQAHEAPLLVSFFTRPESLCGLHQLAFFVTNDTEIVTSPWGAGCTSLVTWPMRCLLKGQTRAVLGGWDVSARKFFSGDELSFTLPYPLFETMLNRYPESFLTRKNWDVVRKKIDRSRKAWEK